MATVAVADDGGDSATFLGTDDWTNDAEEKAFDVATTCVMVRMKTVNFIIVDFTRYRFINGDGRRRRFVFCVRSNSGYRTNSYVDR